MPSIGKLLSLNGGLPERVSSTDNATLTGDISGLGAVNLSSVTASGAVSSASLAVSGEADISGGLDVSGNFAVTGTSAHTGGATFASTVDISGALDLSGALTSSSSASFAGAMDAASLALSGNLDVSGSFDLSGAAVMSDTLNVAGAVTMTSSLNVSGDSQFAADVMVSGDLSVNGKIISRLQTDVVIKDTYLDLAFGNSTSGTSSVASQAGGFTVGQARNTNFTAGAVSAFPSASTFTYADTGSSTLLAAGDVVAISGLPQEFAENEGYFVVASVSGASFPQTVTIETSLQQSLAWAQTSFTAGTPQSAGEAFKPNLSILAVADGTMAYKSGAGAAWPVGTLVLASYIGGGANGATKTLFQANGAYVAVGAGSTTLQNAYENGEVITTDSTHGNVVIAGDQALVVSASGGVDISGALDVSGALAVDGAADLNSTLDVAGAASLASTLDVSGALTVDGAADLNSTLNVGGHAEFESSVDVSGALAVTGAADFASTVDISGALVVDGAADLNSTLDVAGAATFASTVDISGATDISGALTVSAQTRIDAASQSWFKVAGAELQLATTTSGELDLTSAGLMDVNAGANLDIDVTGTASLDATGTISINTTNGTYNIATVSGDADAVTIGNTHSSTKITLVGPTATKPSAIQLQTYYGMSYASVTADVVDIGYNSVLAQTATTTYVKASSSVLISSNSVAILAGNDLNLSSNHVRSYSLRNGSGSTIGLYQVLAFTGNTGGSPVLPLVTLADCDSVTAVTAQSIAGINGTATVNANSSITRFTTVFGTSARVQLTTSCLATDAGKPVYLSATAGQATLTAPTASGSSVIRLGYILGASSTQNGVSNVALIVYAPQFIAQIP